jgi:threonine/homoserine/homoserine lactone efflux protein
MLLPVDPSALILFVPAALALNLTPGADMAFCLAQGLRAGPRAAMAANLGIALGCLAHAVLAGLGLAALVAAHPGLYEAIRWAGVAYLLWLAVQALRAGPVPPATDEAPGSSFRGADGAGRVLLTALAVNLLNPKVILFMLAFVPQFCDPARPLLPQFLLFGAVLCLGGLAVNGAVGVSAGGLGRRLARSPLSARWLGRVSAAIFAGLAARLAWSVRG